MIKYIVETTSMWDKTNGYSSHFARITSTKTKKSLVIHGVGGPSNAAALLMRKPEDGTRPLVTGWSEVYATQKWESATDWKRMNKFAGGDDGKVYEHTFTPTMVRRLNRA